MTHKRIIKNIANNTYKPSNNGNNDVNWRVKQLLVQIIVNKDMNVKR